MGVGQTWTRTWRRPRSLATLVAGALTLTACVGTISGDEFDAIVNERGGGVSSDLLHEVFDTLRDRTGESDPVVRNLYVGFNPTYASVEVQSSTQPGNVDDYVIYGNDVRWVDPVQDPDEVPTIRLSEVPVDQVEAIADRALAEFGVSGGYVDSLYVDISNRQMRLDLESDRATGTATFALDGTFQEFHHS